MREALNAVMSEWLLYKLKVCKSVPIALSNRINMSIEYVA
ncbi:hypothetical protein Sps_00504 [Shewanella psychrophila]|uniref:Uncharacterized protein n=1 Tax=Shewanella psychrophila TaxID=225848 RepID=A0A1S6HJM8_9GAMM|nr:hypothetical protein Sps_00504 [Shewanella psychrophila]